MAGNISSHLANALLEHLTGKTALTISSVYVGLLQDTNNLVSGVSGFSVASTGWIAEVTKADYHRQTTSWGYSSSGAIVSVGNATFTSSTNDWGKITGVGLYDSYENGNLLWFGYIDPVTMVSNDVFVAQPFTLSLG